MPREDEQFSAYQPVNFKNYNDLYQGDQLDMFMN